MIAWLLAGAALQVQLAQPLPADSVEAIRKAARRAETEFERLARSLAPLQWGPSGQQCDEVVGRFCLTYDSGALPRPEPESPRITDARRLAIDALRLAFSYEADRLETSGPLVRYLVEDDRAAEAVSAARTYAALSPDTVWRSFLLGFALHAAAEDTAAERLFGDAMRRLETDDVGRIHDVHWLLSDSDRGVYKKLTTAEKRRAERELWRFADPLYLTPGNEHWAEHVSRHVWSRVLAMAPVVRDMVRWGRDLEQLTVRYGVPTAKTRTWGSFGREGSLVEHYDPGQLAFVPEDFMSRGPPPAPLPGESWGLENPRSRSGHAPRTIRKLIALPHQVTLFPSADGPRIRMDAELPLDSAAAGKRAFVAGLFLLDDSLTVQSEQRTRQNSAGDTLRFTLEAPLPNGTHVYSLEALETETRFAGRARYVLDDSMTMHGLRVSDPLLVEPFGDGPRPVNRTDHTIRPVARLVFPRERTIGMYAEVHGLSQAAADASYRIELSIHRADRASLPSRMISWLGSRLGLSSSAPPPRLSWVATASESGPVPLAVDVGLHELDRGFHVLVLEVTDLRTAARAESRKIIRID
jgi:hypothetical protein